MNADGPGEERLPPRSDPDAPSRAAADATLGGDVPLLDGATPDPDFFAEIEALRRRVANRSAPIDTRLEAFEDIIDSEVGDTILWRAKNIERELGIRQIWLKFEGSNPTGTQKDRIAFAQVLDALRRGFDAVTVATCGNYGAAVSLAASIAQLRCIVYIPESYHPKRLDEIRRGGAEIVRCPGDYEKAVLESRERAERDDFYDANPGGKNTPMQLRAYAEVASEIYDDLRDAPAAVAVPVSNGTTLAGIYRGFASLFRRGKTSHIPRFVAGSSRGQNPIVRSYLRNLPHCVDLDPGRVRETSVNEPLINWHSSDGEQALQAVRASNGWAADATDRDMLALAKTIRTKEGLHVLPASCSGLLALVARHRKDPLPGDRYVAVLTGRRE